MCVCVLPVLVPVQLKYVTGSVRWLLAVGHVQAVVKGHQGGVVLQDGHAGVGKLKGQCHTSRERVHALRKRQPGEDDLSVPAAALSELLNTYR